MTRTLGKQPGAQGFGLMGLTWRPVNPPLEQSLETLRTAVQNGCTIWNAGEFYGTPEYNSMTVIKHYFTKYPEDAEKVTLFMKGCNDLDTLHPNGTPEGVRRSIDNVLEQIGGVKKVDGFGWARRDASVPIEVTLGVIQKEYIDTGKIGGVFISECSAATVHEAAKHANILAAEVEVSLFATDTLTNGVAEALGEHDIPILAYSPIGRGMLANRFKDASQVKEVGMLSTFPRMQPEAFEHNLKLVHQVNALAEKKGCTPPQLAISWVAGLGNRPGLPTVVPIPGATTAARVEENSKRVTLTDQELKDIDDLIQNFEVSGARYPAHVPMET